jgi:hypothetical protein
MANIDFDDHYEWLCARAEKLDELCQEWLRETIAAGDDDELYLPCGDDLTPTLLEVGKRFEGFEEALAEALYGKCYKSIGTYVDGITEWQEEWGL